MTTIEELRESLKRLENLVRRVDADETRSVRSLKTAVDELKLARAVFTAGKAFVLSSEPPDWVAFNEALVAYERKVVNTKAVEGS